MKGQYNLIRGWVGVEPEIMLDIGACHGESIRNFSGIWPNCKIISFEPRKHAWPNLKKAADAHGNATVMPFGLGSKTETLEITEYPTHPGGSSLLESNIYHKATRAWTKKQVRYEVEIRRLDDVEIPEGSLFIKVDVEGSAASVIDGGQETFLRAYGAVIETDIRKRYLGGCAVSDLKARMEKLGFSLCGWSYRNRDWGDLVWKR